MFADAYNTVVQRSLAESERISAVLKTATVTQNWEAAIKRGSVGHGQRFIAQFEQVSKVIAAREVSWYSLYPSSVGP